MTIVRATLFPVSQPRTGPDGEFTLNYLEEQTGSLRAVTEQDARAAAAFELLLPDVSAAPLIGRVLRAAELAPAADGVGYRFLYRSAVELTVVPTRRDPSAFVDRLLGQTYAPSPAKPNEVRHEYAQVRILGLRAAGHDPYDVLVFRDGMQLFDSYRVPATLTFVVSGGRAGPNVAYTLTGEDVPLDTLVRIARTMR